MGHKVLIIRNNVELNGKVNHIWERKNSFMMIMTMIVSQLTEQKRAHTFYLEGWRRKTLIPTKQSLIFKFSKVSSWNSVFKKHATFSDFPKSQLNAPLPPFQQTSLYHQNWLWETLLQSDHLDYGGFLITVISNKKKCFIHKNLYYSHKNWKPANLDRSSALDLCWDMLWA